VVRRNAEVGRIDLVNQLAVIITPAKPFLDWLHRVDPKSAELGLKDLRREATNYLVPGYDRDEEAHRFLENTALRSSKNNWTSGSCAFAWPVDRSFDTFVHWFEYNFHSVS
jgi:hypothetical protein